MATNKWQLDPSHSEIQFKVKHLMISTVTGHFKNFTLTATTVDDDFTKVQDILLVINSDSIDTNNESRDTHLRSADFLNTTIFDSITFSNAVYEGTAAEGTLTGHLTVAGITKKISLNIEQGGIAKDPHGQVKAGFTLQGKISRKEFGLTWDAVTETGKIVVSDEIRISCEIQLIKL